MADKHQKGYEAHTRYYLQDGTLGSGSTSGYGAYSISRRSLSGLTISDFKESIPRNM